MQITQHDGITGESKIIEITAEELAEIRLGSGPSKSIDDMIAEKQALQNAAMTKLAALGLTEDEAKAIIG